MKTYIYLFLLTAVLFSCKKETNNNDSNTSQFTVEGLTDFQMMQACDTVVIPVTVSMPSGNREPFLLSVANLPDNLIATAQVTDSLEGKYNITFTSYYFIDPYRPIWNDRSLKSGEIIPAGVLYPRLVISTSHKAEQFEFGITITNHPILAVVGDYYQSHVYPGFDTVVNHKMKVSVIRIMDTTLGLLSFEDIILGGTTTTWNTFLNTTSGQINSAPKIDTTFDVPYAVFGTYSDRTFTFTAPPLMRYDVTLRR